MEHLEFGIEGVEPGFGTIIIYFKLVWLLIFKKKLIP